MIVVAVIWILVEAIEKWLAGLPLEHLGSGTLLWLVAGMLNAWLGGICCGWGSAATRSFSKPTAITC
jgi:hypothetical protein